MRNSRNCVKKESRSVVLAATALSSVQQKRWQARLYRLCIQMFHVERQDLREKRKLVSCSSCYCPIIYAVEALPGSSTSGCVVSMLVTVSLNRHR